ncbi:MAG: alpha/beta fold hydrolase [Acidimicrobiia bacterium]
MSTAAATIVIGNGLRLSFAERGDESGPTLLLLPGPTDSWPSYEPVLSRLPSSIHVIALSLRGHGDSDKPAFGYQVEDFAADVVAFLDAVSIGSAVLAGHSGSCLVARRVAIDWPERVAGLVLEASPTTLKGDAQLEAFVQSTVLNLVDPIGHAFARRFVVDTSTDLIGEEIVERLVEELLKVPTRVWKETMSGLMRYDDLDELDLILAPTLLIWGDSDPLVGLEMQKDLVRAIPNATLSRYPGIGHTPRWEDPTRFAKEVGAFVRRSNQRESA